MLSFFSCGKISRNKTLDVQREGMPGLHAWDVSTVISDSGITRYRMESPEWLVYDKVQEPYWFFPDGVHFEKFDENLEVFAEVDADSAIYFTKTEKWTLMRNVKAMNLEGEHFETELLYIDQQADRIYTNEKIKVTQADKIINGIGFESNQRLSKYTILNPTGIIPIEEEADTVSTSEIMTENNQ